MRDTDLIQKALPLSSSPWYVKNSQFDPDEGQLKIEIDFERGGKFECPNCEEADCSAYDTDTKEWRHLNFFQHETYISARVPRVDCPDCGVKTVEVPWARPESGFTLLFEAYLMTLAKEMPVEAIARVVGEHDTRIWRVVHHYVGEAREEADYSDASQIGVDETAIKRGHDYVSLFVDLEDKRVIYVTDGKDKAAIEQFELFARQEGVDPNKVSEFCCDMSPAFISGIEECFPEAHITFDKFHIIKMLNKAVDKVRRSERKKRSELKHTKYIWLKNPTNLTDRQKKKLEELNLPETNLQTGRAYRIKIAFQEIYNHPKDVAEILLKKWYSWAIRSQIYHIKKFAKTVKQHWDGILRWFTSGISNGILEGINSLVQAAKARARGYRSPEYLKSMIYLIAGKLPFQITHTK